VDVVVVEDVVVELVVDVEVVLDDAVLELVLDALTVLVVEKVDVDDADDDDVVVDVVVKDDVEVDVVDDADVVVVVIVEKDEDEDVDELDAVKVVAVVAEDVDVVLKVFVDEVVVVDVVVEKDDELDVVVVVKEEVLVVVDDVVVDTDVVAVDVRLDVCVVEGDVISQPKNDPSSCFATSMLNASDNSSEVDLPSLMVSAASLTAKIIQTLPSWSGLHSRLNKFDEYRVDRGSTISLRNAPSPVSVFSRQESRSALASTRP